MQAREESLIKYALLPAVLGSLLLGGVKVQHGGPVENAVAALRTDSVYLDPGSGRNLDMAAVRAAIGTAPIKLAILPRIESVNQVAVLPRTLATSLPGNTIGVISGRYFYAGSEVVCKGSAGEAAAKTIKANEAALDAENSADSPADLTKPLTDFITAIKAAPACPADGTRADRYADAPGGGALATGPDDTSSVLPWVLSGIGAGVLVIGTVTLLIWRRTRRVAAARWAETVEELRELGGKSWSGS